MWRRDKIYIFLIIGFLSLSFASHAQVFTIDLNQAPVLKANAGADITISYLQGCRLGGFPTAEFGYGNYTYLWEPADGISNPTIANPMAYPISTTIYKVTVSDRSHCLAQDEITIKVEASGREDVQNPCQVRIFPNPSDGFLNLHLEGFSGETQYRIFDALGKLVRTKTTDIQMVYQEELDLRWLEKGLYYIRIHSTSGQASKVFMIQ